MQTAWQKQIKSSVILTGIRRFFSRIYKKFIHPAKRKSIIDESRSRSSRPLSFRQNISKHLYKDTLGRIIHTISDTLLFTVCQAYGMAVLSFSLTSAFIYLLKQVFQITIAPYSSDTLFVVLALAIVSVILLFFDKPFIDTVQSGRLLSYFLTDILAISLRRPDHTRKGIPLGAAFLYGAILGALSFFFSPIRILTWLVFAFILIAIINTPEATLSFLVILMPLSGWFRFGSLSLVIIVAVGLLSYLLKLFLNKRDFSLRVSDFSIIMGALLYFFGGLISSGGMNSFHHGLVSAFFLLIYFLSANLLPRETSFYRFFHLFSLCGFFVAAFAIVSFFWGEEVGFFLEIIPLTHGKNGIGDFFGNRDTLSLYLFFAVLVAPAMTSVRKSLLSKFGYILAFLSMLTALFLVASPMAIFALFAGTVLFAFLQGKRNPLVPLLVILLIPLLLVAIPADPLLTLFSFLPKGVLDPLSAFLLHKEALWDLLLPSIGQYIAGGIGIGKGTVSDFLSSLSPDALSSTGNLYLYTTVALGITGLVFLILLFISLLTDMVHHKNAERNDPIRILHAAVFSCLIAIFSVGILGDPFSDIRIFCLFFCFFGIASALTRLGYIRKEEYSLQTKGESNSASTDIAVID